VCVCARGLGLCVAAALTTMLYVHPEDRQSMHPQPRGAVCQTLQAAIVACPAAVAVLLVSALRVTFCRQNSARTFRPKTNLALQRVAGQNSAIQPPPQAASVLNKITCKLSVAKLVTQLVYAGPSSADCYAPCPWAISRCYDPSVCPSLCLSQAKSAALHGGSSF